MTTVYVERENGSIEENINIYNVALEEGVLQIAYTDENVMITVGRQQTFKKEKTMSKKPSEATQNLRDKAQGYIDSLEGEGRFTLPELIEHLQEEHPGIVENINNLRVTVANTLKHFDGSTIVNTGEKDTDSKRKGPNPVVWRRMTDDDHLRIEFQKQQIEEQDSSEEISSGEEIQEEPLHEDIQSTKEDSEQESSSDVDNNSQEEGTTSDNATGDSGQDAESKSPDFDF